MNSVKGMAKDGLETIVSAIGSEKGEKAAATAKIVVGGLAAVAVAGIAVSAAVTGFPYMVQNAKEAAEAVQSVMQNSQAAKDYATAAIAAVKAFGLPVLALYGGLNAFAASLELATEGKDRLAGIKYEQQYRQQTTGRG